MSSDRTPLSALLAELRARKISFQLMQVRDEAVMIAVAVPGQWWEIELMADGSVEVERFVSDGTIQGREALDELFARFSD